MLLESGTSECLLEYIPKPGKPCLPMFCGTELKRSDQVAVDLLGFMKGAFVSIHLD
jgi:hypothetical protein